MPVYTETMETMQHLCQAMCGAASLLPEGNKKNTWSTTYLQKQQRANKSTMEMAKITCEKMLWINDNFKVNTEPQSYTIRLAGSIRFSCSISQLAGPEKKIIKK